MGRIQPKGRRENEEAVQWEGDVLPVDDRNVGVAAGRELQVATATANIDDRLIEGTQQVEEEA